MSPAETERAVKKIRELARAIDIVIIEHDMEVVFENADDNHRNGARGRSSHPATLKKSPRTRASEAYLGGKDDEDYFEEEAHA
jgi:branched-chain amino acid transport system ATP-binding protein